MPKPVQVLGVDEAIRAFHRLEDSVAGKELRKATMQGARPIRAEARRLVRKRSGKLMRAIGLRSKSHGRYRAEADVGFDRRMAWYGGMIELGHRLVKGRKKRDKKVIGHVPAYPYLRPALETKAKEAEAAMREHFRINISRVVARGNR